MSSSRSEGSFDQSSSSLVTIPIDSSKDSIIEKDELALCDSKSNSSMFIEVENVSENDID